MLGLLIFMGDRNHNTAIEGRAPLQATLHSRLRGEHAPTNQERPRAILANPDGATFTVRFWDYSRKPSNRIPRKPLKTLDRKISTREKFRFSVFHFLSLLSGGQHRYYRHRQRPHLGLSRHACREKSPASPAASTKLPKLLGTLSAYWAAKRRQLKVTL